MPNEQAPKVVGIQNRSVLYEAPPAALVPEGAYGAELIDVRRFTNSFGDRVGLVFKIDKGAHAGAIIMETAAFKDSQRGKLAELLRGLGGAPWMAGRDVIGRYCTIVVRHEATKAGKPYAAISQTIQF